LSRPSPATYAHVGSYTLTTCTEGSNVFLSARQSEVQRSLLVVPRKPQRALAQAAFSAVLLPVYETRLLPDEHALVVRISKDGEMRFLDEGQHDVIFADERGKKSGIVTVWELPEDEFWFFRAFRPALFGLEKALPGFLFEMGITHAYAMFEGYLSAIIRSRLRQHPRLMSGQRELKYEQVFLAESKETLIERMIEREMRELMYLSLPDLLRKLRDQMGFKSLADEHDENSAYALAVF
jgi:hypothetical protein